MLGELRVLVAKDDPILADGLSEMIREADGVMVGPFATVSEALAFLREGSLIHATVVDVDLGDGASTAVLETLHARGIPTLVYTGGNVPDDVRARHPELILLSKPVPPACLIAELRRISGKLVT